MEVIPKFIASNGGVISAHTPRLRIKNKTKPAYLILHFPPQSFAEEAFHEAAPPNLPEPNPSTSASPPAHPPGPPRARIANESRLVFIAPVNCDIDYTLSSILEACKEWPLKVAKETALSAGADFTKVSSIDIRTAKDFLNVTDLPLLAKPIIPDSIQGWEAPPVKYGASHASAVVKTLLIGAKGDLATLRARQLAVGDIGDSTVPIQLFLPDSSGSLQPTSLNPNSLQIAASVQLHSGLTYAANPNLLNTSLYAKLGNPDAVTTSIEMPWRLILSPDGFARWRHANEPVFSFDTNHTELWHSRLVTPQADGQETEPPNPDKKRTVRAVWALQGEGGEGTTVAMQTNWPSTNNLPITNDNPFVTTLNNNDRYQIAHLSSNFKKTGYTPEPINTNLMMLSAMGGWLDSRGVWDPPLGFSVEEWTNRATMGRDHFVRLVKRGYLFPFGHRVSLVKITERKFHHNNNEEGNPAYLRQRFFIIIREKERTYDSDEFKDAAYSSANPQNRYKLSNKFPFSRVRILTETTPDLEAPGMQPSSVKIFSGANSQNEDYVQGGSYGSSMFWPHVGGNPFLFQCAATDLDGRRALFSIPMIFVEATLASPYDGESPDYGAAECFAMDAMNDFNSRPVYSTADFNWQRVALAASQAPGDTSLPVSKIRFGGLVQKENPTLRTYSDKLNLPIWVPQVEEVNARIDPIAQLSGSQEPHTLTYNEKYLLYGFGSENEGQVFVDIKPDSGPDLDFSSQGDKSGGFIQPNIRPKALSRITGPVMSSVDDYIEGNLPPGAGFPMSDTDLSALPGFKMPLLFGCIPLGAIVKGANGINYLKEHAPKFISEAATKIESFISDLNRLYELIADIPSQPVNIAKGALAAFNDTLKDIMAQAIVCNEGQLTSVNGAASAAQAAIDGLISNLVTSSGSDPSAPPGIGNWLVFDQGVNNVRAAVNDVNGLKDLAGLALPSGIKQSVLNTAQQLNALMTQLEMLHQLADSAEMLWKALDAIIGDPGRLAGLLTTGRVGDTSLAGLLETLKAAIDEFLLGLETSDLLDGAPRNILRAALKAVKDLLDSADFEEIVKLLTGEELTVRFDWKPKISSWGLSGGALSTDPLFRANDENGLLVAVEAKVRKSGSSGSKISVFCSLKHFDLILLAPAKFFELNFEKIEFLVDSASKMNVDVLLSGVKFVGVLSFVETLRDLIPLDGFSDPPYLDITKEGIDAGFSISLPSITCGILNIANISLGAGFTVPFIGQPLSVRFNFCSREKPFLLTVLCFGGGGWFNITISPNGVQILEAGFEFGAAISIDFGVASGGVHVMAGIYYRMENSEASLTGYFRMGGNLRVLGLINASIELYLSLTYEFSTGKCVGKASLTIGVSIAFFSTKVTIFCERKFAGSNGDPTLRQMLGHNPNNVPDLTLEEELGSIDEKTHYAWREYIEAFV
jgi:hypothetical protein